MSRSCATSAPTSTIVDAVGRSSGRASRRSRSSSGMLASSTLPFDEQCSGVLRPTQLTLTIARVPEI